MDVEKQAAYWSTGSAEDFAAAMSLLQSQHPRHALFFAHLAVEKALKAHVTRATTDVPPRIHDLLRLADLAGLPPAADRREFLARFQQYCLAGRYPDFGPPEPTTAEATEALTQVREVLAWLQSL